MLVKIENTKTKNNLFYKKTRKIGHLTIPNN